MNDKISFLINIEDVLAPNKEHLYRVLQVCHVENTI